MKLTSDVISKIKSTVDEMDLYSEYDTVGIRVQDEEFDLGQIDHCSHIWVDGDDTEEELDGISVTDFEDLDDVVRDMNRGNWYYSGAHLAIICGNDWVYGEDAGEKIISDPVVVAVIC